MSLRVFYIVRDSRLIVTLRNDNVEGHVEIKQ